MITAAVLASSGLMVAAPASATGVTVTSTTTAVANSNGTTALSGVTITGYTTETLLVSVSTTIGTLSMSTSTGLTLSYGYSSFSGSSLSFTGTQANVGPALASMSLVDAGTTGTAQIALSVTVDQAGISYFAGTGHFYQYVGTAGTWTAAATAATADTFDGQSGYLASIPTAAVNTFVEAHINGASNVWAGGGSVDYPLGYGGDMGIQRVWTWQGGPLAGTIFTECSNIDTQCMLANDTGLYHDWNTGEPNNSGYSVSTAGSGEHSLEVNYSGVGTWNDLAGSNVAPTGYVVEYGDLDQGGNFTGEYSASTSLLVASVASIPTSVTATAGNAQALVSWTAPANGGSAITGYIVTPYLGLAAQAPQTFLSVAASDTLTGLSNGSTYTFTVVATNTVGNGSASAASNAVLVATVPSAPTSVTASVGNTQAVVSWTAPANGGSAITGYIVTPYLGLVAQAPQTFLTISPSDTLTGLINGSSYTFTVAATNTLGNGSASAASNVVTPAVPSAPTTTVTTAPPPVTTPTVSVPPVTTPAVVKPLVSTGGGVAATPGDAGYWALTGKGMLSAHGNATDLGSENAAHLNAPVIAVISTPSGLGYWETASDGAVFAFGNASFHGSLVGTKLTQPIVAMAAAPDGQGYWLVDAAGGVFSFGDAKLYGSLTGMRLNRDIVGITATSDGRGYWLVAADGGVFTFGDASFFGSMAAVKLNKPVVGIAITPDGRGYWLVAADGGVFTFGDGRFFGSLGRQGTTQVSGIIADNDHAYRLISAQGTAFSFGA
jgi:hypothetical protein